MSPTRRTVLATAAAASLTPATAVAEHAGGSWGHPRGDRRNTGHAAVDGARTGLGIDWRWRGDSALAAYPAPVGDRAFVGLEDGTVAALDAADGSERWTVALDAMPTLAVTPGVDRAFAPTNEGTIVALDRASGERDWRRAVEGGLYTPVNATGDALVYGTRDGAVAVRDPADGRRRWRQSVGDAVDTAPVVVEDLVIARAKRGAIVALDRADGSERWLQTGTAGLPPSGFAGPVVRGDLVYAEATTPDGRRLVALERSTGDVAWERRVEGRVMGLLARPDRVIAFHGDAVHAHDPADGTVQWRTERSERVRLASATDAVYAVGDDALAVLDPSTGDPVAEFDPDGRPIDRLPAVGRDVATVGGPAVIPGGLLVVGDDDALYAVRAGAGGLDAVGLGLAGGLGVLGVGAYVATRLRGDRASDGGR